MLHIVVVVVHSSIKECCCCFEDFNATDKKECAGFFQFFSSFWREKAHRGTLLRGAPRTLRV